MLDRHAYDIAVRVQIDQKMFADFPGFMDILAREHDMGGIRVREMYYPHSAFHLKRSAIEGATNMKSFVAIIKVLDPSDLPSGKRS